MAKAICLLSGGMDSATAAWLMRSAGYEIFAISFDYSQRHRRELEAAQALAGKLDAPWRLVDLTSLAPLLAGSALTDENVSIPDGHYESDTMKATVVPNRNAIMLTVACAWAATEGAEIVVFGAHGGDHAIYPDCRPEFVSAFDAMERLAMDGSIPTEFRVHAPFLGMRKEAIVSLGTKLCVPFELTWSCYKGGEIHCGTCGTCTERKEAFEKSNTPDPTRYED